MDFVDRKLAVELRPPLPLPPSFFRWGQERQLQFLSIFWDCIRLISPLRVSLRVFYNSASASNPLYFAARDAELRFYLSLEAPGVFARYPTRDGYTLAHSYVFEEMTLGSWLFGLSKPLDDMHGARSDKDVFLLRLLYLGYLVSERRLCDFIQRDPDACFRNSLKMLTQSPKLIALTWKKQHSKFPIPSNEVVWAMTPEQRYHLRKLL